MKKILGRGVSYDRIGLGNGSALRCMSPSLSLIRDIADTISKARGGRELGLSSHRGSLRGLIQKYLDEGISQRVEVPDRTVSPR